MNAEYKSISQLANELQVTRQTIYNKLKDKALSESVKPYIVKQGNFTFYTVKAQELIKQAVLGGDVKENFTECQREFDNVSKELTACKNELDSVSKDFTKCQNDLTECKKELDTKDKIINELNIKIAELQAIEQTVKALQSQLTDKSQTIEDLRAQITELRADKAFLQSQLKEVTTALKAAQALHGIENKNKVISVKAEPRPTGAATRQEPRAQERPHKKLSLMDKLRAAADIFKR